METESLDSGSREQRFQAILAEYLQALEAGQAPSREELLGRHPDLADELALFFANQEQFERLAERHGPAAGPARGVSQPGHRPAGAQAGTPTLPSGEALVTSPVTKIRYFGDYELLEE